MFFVWVPGHVSSEDYFARGKVHDHMRIPRAIHVPPNEDTLLPARLEFMLTLQYPQVPDRAEGEESLHAQFHPSPILMR